MGGLTLSAVPPCADSYHAVRRGSVVGDDETPYRGGSSVRRRSCRRSANPAAFTCCKIWLIAAVTGVSACWMHRTTVALSRRLSVQQGCFDSHVANLSLLQAAK